MIHQSKHCGPGSSVGIATGYGLDGPGIESRWGARFSAPVQTGPEAHPASCTIGTGSFTGSKSDRGVTLTPHPLLPWSWKSGAIPVLPLRAVRPVQSLSAHTGCTFYQSRHVINFSGRNACQYRRVRMHVIIWKKKNGKKFCTSPKIPKRLYYEVANSRVFPNLLRFQEPYNPLAFKEICWHEFKYFVTLTLVVQCKFINSQCPWSLTSPFLHAS